MTTIAARAAVPARVRQAKPPLSVATAILLPPKLPVPRPTLRCPAPFPVPFPLGGGIVGAIGRAVAKAKIARVESAVASAIGSVDQAIAARKALCPAGSRDPVLAELEQAKASLEAAQKGLAKMKAEIDNPPKFLPHIPTRMLVERNLASAAKHLDAASKLCPPQLIGGKPSKPGPGFGPPIPPIDVNPVSRAIGKAKSGVTLAQFLLR